MSAHRFPKTYFVGIAVCSIIAFGALMPTRARAENPFGSVDGAPPPPPAPGGPTDFQPEDDFPQANQGDNLGFGGPANKGATPPSNGPKASAPTTTRRPPGGRPAKLTPPNRSAVANADTGSSMATDAVKAESKAQKLADYLELDPSVRGLEVKNFDLPDKEIKDVVTLISKWTGKNFILDSKVRGKITIIGPSQVTLQEAYQAFLSALDANGLTTVQAGKFIRIIESAEARRSPVKTYAGDYAPKDDQFITRIFQLKYINSDEVQREFRDLTTRQGKLFAYEPTNSIIITDTGSNIERIKEILGVLDVKGFETKLYVIRIKNSPAKNISEMLGEIYGDKSGNGQRTFRRTELERTRGGGVIAKIIPDEGTNSLVILANQAGYESLQELVSKLDVKVSNTGRIHVYYCEYAKAEDLAATLAALTSGTAAKSSTSKPGGTGAPGSSSPVIPGRSGPVSADLEGGVKVTSDTPTNALVITANSNDYQTLKKVIKKLDIPRLQVFVESAILEIDISDSNTVGVNAALGAPGIGFAGGFVGDAASLTQFITSQPPTSGAFIPIFAGPAFNANIGQTPGTVGTPIQVRTFMGLIKLLTSNSNTSVLSTPQIIALDNEKAEFKVLQETPVQTSFTVAVSAVPGSTPGTGTVDRLKTGIQIKLTPHVNAASGNIRLEIEQQVDDINTATSATPSALSSINVGTTSRVANTQVVVHDQDYIMMGGLMSNTVVDTEQKVPLLGDIPILGWLFKSKTHQITKQNLVLLLHPKIIGTTLAAATQVSESLDARGKFIDKNMSGEDEYSGEIKNLRAQLKLQSERGKSTPNYNYRNNDDEDDIKPHPGDQSELNGGSGSSKSEKAAKETGPATGNTGAPGTAVAPDGNPPNPLLGNPGGDGQNTIPPPLPPPVTGQGIGG